MILNCKEFDINGQKIAMGHDRETGKRYYCQEVRDIMTDNDTGIISINYNNIRIGKFERAQLARDQLKAIFWIK